LPRGDGEKLRVWTGPVKKKGGGDKGVPAKH